MREYLQRPVSMAEAEALSSFIRTFRASLDARLWMKLIIEEAKEVIHAFKEETPEQQLKELADLRYVAIGATLVSSRFIDSLVGPEDIALVDVSDALYDEIETLSEGVFTVEQLAEAFERVHESNMSKLDENGEPLIREDGKILKGPNYKAPDLSDLVADE